MNRHHCGRRSTAAEAPGVERCRCACIVQFHVLSATPLARSFLLHAVCPKTFSFLSFANVAVSFYGFHRLCFCCPCHGLLFTLARGDSVAMSGAHRAPDLPLAAAVAQWLCRVQVARFVNLAHLARQSLFSLCSTACSCDVFGRGELQVVM